VLQQPGGPNFDHLDGLLLGGSCWDLGKMFETSVWVLAGTWRKSAGERAFASVSVHLFGCGVFASVVFSACKGGVKSVAVKGSTFGLHWPLTCSPKDQECEEAPDSCSETGGRYKCSYSTVRQIRIPSRSMFIWIIAMEQGKAEGCSC
jgi:hypothetical protein